METVILKPLQHRGENRQYEDKDGAKKYVTEILAEQVILMDKKGQG
jgi:single-stranded DNA-binding protein